MIFWLLVSYALFTFSLSLITAAVLAPPEAWHTPIGSTSDNEVQDDVR